jgi:hypothetical protein
LQFDPNEKQGAHCVLPVDGSGLCCGLLAGTLCLHAVAGIAQLQGGFLSLEADAGERVGTAAVLMSDSSIVVGWRLKLNYMRRYFCYYVLAFQNAEFDVGAAALPLTL